MSKIGVLLLAAGKSTRFGGDKLLTPITINGIRLPIIAHTLNAYQSLHLPIKVLTHSLHTELHDFLKDYKIPYLICPHAHLGMGHSLSCAVRNNQNWEGWLVGLADMPYIKPSTLKMIMDNSHDDKIVRPTYHHEGEAVTQLDVIAKKISQNNILGHPVFFPFRFAYGLSRLRGDVGARELIKHHWHEQKLIKVDDPGILIDIDRPIDIIE